MTTDKALLLIDGLIEDIKKINHNDVIGFNDWKATALITMNRITPSNTLNVQIKSLDPSRYSATITNVDVTIARAIKILEAEKKNIKILGLPDKTLKQQTLKSGDIHVNVNQQNTQTQSVEVKLNIIIDTLKDELRRPEYEALKVIAESSDTPEEKKKSFFEKFKSFGIDTTSNILGGILSNPEVWKMFQ